MTGTQLTFDGVAARCEYVDARAEAPRGEPCVLACVLPPHGDGMHHRLEWVPVGERYPRPVLVAIEGGRL